MIVSSIIIEINRKRMKGIIDYFILDYAKKSSQKKTFIEFIFLCMLIICSVMAIYTLIFISFDMIEIGIVTLLSFLAISSSLFLFKRKKRVSTISDTFMIINYLSFVAVILLTGKTNSPFITWIIAIPVCSFLIQKNMKILIWTILSFLFYTLILIFPEHKVESYNLTPNNYEFAFLIITQIVMYLAIFTIGYFSWIKLFKKYSDEIVSKNYAFIKFTDVELLIMDWNFLKYKFSKKFNSQIEAIDSLEFLTPHEKKYTLIDYFKLDLILIAETLNVSTRTVETNYYRIRKKIKENNHSDKYPYQKIK